MSRVRRDFAHGRRLDDTLRIAAVRSMRRGVAAPRTQTTCAFIRACRIASLRRELLTAMPSLVVMLVEDHEDTLQMYSEYLQDAGIGVVENVTPETAFERAVEVQPSVIVTDYRMAPVSGLELCRQLRAHPSMSQTPLIMLTGHTVAADLELFRTVCNAVVVKPCAPDELVKHILQVIK